MVEDSELTLREAVKRLYAQNSTKFSQRETSPAAQEFFRCHDTAHIVFGCDTSIFGEGVLKIFTIFGTTLGFWKHVLAYREADALGLFRQYSLRHIVGHIFQLIVNIPRAVLHAKQMSKPWPWWDHDDYLDRSVADIRNEFKIKVVRRR